MNYPALIKAIGSANFQLQGRAAAAVNQALVLRNWLVGAWIVEYEQNGKDRAKYGARLLETLAADLAQREVKGLSEPRVLRECRSLYSIYPQIRGTLSRELGNSDEKRNQPLGKKHNQPSAHFILFHSSLIFTALPQVPNEA